MTRVKICGNTSREDVRIAVDAGADAVGFVTEVPVETPRNLSLEEASELVSSTPPFVSTALVIMPPDLERAIEMVEEAEPDVVQVHNDLPPGDVGALRDLGVKVVKKVAPDVEEAERYDFVDALLVDTEAEDGGGGTGETHDWRVSAEIQRGVSPPLLLAGGLTPGNVAEAVREVEPYGVDVSSGVEWKGEKRLALVEDFVVNARRADGDV